MLVALATRPPDPTLEWRALGLIATTALVVVFRGGIAGYVFGVHRGLLAVHIASLVAFVAAVLLALFAIAPDRFTPARLRGREPSERFFAAVVCFVVGFVLTAVAYTWAALDTLDNEGPFGG